MAPLFAFLWILGIVYIVAALVLRARNIEIGFFLFWGLSPASMAASFVVGLQLIASFAGNGRPVPGVWMTSWIRLIFSLVLAMYAGWCLSVADQRFDTPQPEPVFGTVILIGHVCLCALFSRLRLPGLLAPAHVLQLLARWIFTESPRSPLMLLPTDYPLFMSLGIRWPEPITLIAVSHFSAMLIVIGALRWLRLTRERLALLGITPWAPSDLALVPATVLTATVASPVLMSRLEPWLLPTVALLMAGMLFRLDHRLRLAERSRPARCSTTA